MLQGNFDEAAAHVGIDVCSYRFIPESGAPKLAGITSTLGDYQLLVSRFYDAVKNGPKRGGGLGADVIAATAFEFGYTFPGSVGFVFTIPNERLLLIESELDMSIRLIFEASKAKTPNDVLGYSRKLGPAPIRALYKWVNSHARALLSVDIQWRRGNEVRSNVLLEWQEFDRLERTLSQTSESTKTTLTMPGTLFGVDLSPRTFHFRPDGDAADIRGSVIEAVTSEMEAAFLDKRCIATIEQTTTILFSTEEPRTTYTLLNLGQVGQ